MKKVTLLIILMGIIITGVMVKVALQGVHLSERPLVKWSKLDSFEHVGSRVADFLQSQLKQKKALCFAGESSWAVVFVKSFVSRLQHHGVQTPWQFIGTDAVKPSVDVNCWQMRFREFSTLDVKDRCEQGDKDACVFKRSQRKLKIKDGEEGAWFSLFQTAEGQAVFLLYHSSPIEN